MTDPGVFESVDLPPVIDTSSTDFVEEFYVPLLARATQYKRGVGYFTSGWLRAVSEGMAQFAENGGTARVVASPILDEDDWEAIKRGEDTSPDELVPERMQETLVDLEVSLAEEPRNMLAWLVADDILNIRLVMPKRNLSGDFHDKFGVFTGAEGQQVAFHGSQNDSQQAQYNYESYDIFCSWGGDREARRVTTHEQRFDRIWNDDDPNLNTYSLPESVREDIVELRDLDNRPYNLPDDHGGDVGEITLRDYQQDAVEAWFDNGRRGLFEMATGTGKTYTALGALEQSLDTEPGSALVVVGVPVTHLAAQWENSLSDWGFEDPRYVFGSANPDWRADLSGAISDLNIGIAETEILLTTHKTLSSEYFREQVQGAQVPCYLIADEVHRLGSEQYQKGLLEDYQYRLGLSATPERHYDEEGTSYLLEYFGGIVYNYGLDEAIPEYLTPYEYYPHIVEMTSEELNEYQQLSRKLARAMGSDDIDESVQDRLAMKRARIVKETEDKYRELEAVLEEIGDPDHLLVYTNPRQIDHVQETLNEQSIIQHKFTYHEDDDERDELLEAFDRGEYDALVAMRCLDEGVDVPATRQAILMSNSGNPMQFIQRRGRVLRHAPGKDKAKIYDMIVVPTLDPDRDVIESEREILQKELDRFEEFAANAANEIEARNTIQKVRIAYEI